MKRNENELSKYFAKDIRRLTYRSRYAIGVDVSPRVVRSFPPETVVQVPLVLRAYDEPVSEVEELTWYARGRLYPGVNHVAIFVNVFCDIGRIGQVRTPQNRTDVLTPSFLVHHPQQRGLELRPKIEKVLPGPSHPTFLHLVGYFLRGVPAGQENLKIDNQFVLSLGSCDVEDSPRLLPCGIPLPVPKRP